MEAKREAGLRKDSCVKQLLRDAFFKAETLERLNLQERCEIMATAAAARWGGGETLLCARPWPLLWGLEGGHTKGPGADGCVERCEGRAGRLSKRGHSF